MEVAIANDLFPEVLYAVQQLRLTSPSRETRTFARRVANEKIIFDQFLRRLALVSPQAVNQDEHARDVQVLDVQSRIGSKAVDDIQHDLKCMTEVLHGLKADLSNASRGTAVLAKLGRKTSPLKAPAESSPLQKSLGEVSRTNKRLSGYLLPDFIPLPVEKHWNTPLDVHIKVSSLPRTESRLFKISGSRFTCSCSSTIPGNNTPLQDELFALKQQAEPEGLIHQSEVLAIKVASTSLSSDTSPSSAFEKGPRSSSIGDVQISKQQSASFDQPAATHTRAHIGISPSESPKELVSLPEFIRDSGRDLEPSERAQMAFNVALATILTLIGAPSFDLFDPEACDVYVDSAEPDKSFALFLHAKQNHASASSTSKQSEANAMSIMTRSSSLVRLGLSIIQIMFGRTMAEIEANEPDSTLPDGDPYREDFLTAKKLLTSSRIKNKLGQEFEGVINVCLTQQYRENKTSRVISLLESNASFPEQVSSLILLPLFQELRRAVGCFCGVQDSFGAMLRDHLDLKEDRVGADHDGRSSGDHGNSSWQDINATFNQLSDESAGKDRTPTVSQKLDQPFSPSEQSERGAIPDVVAGQQLLHATNLGDGLSKNPETQTLEQEQSPVESKNRNSESVNKPIVNLLGTTPGTRMFGVGSDPVPESVGSYETTSENTESWLDWMSDETDDDTPEFPESHPLNSLNPISINILAKQYVLWRSCTPSEGQQPGSAGPALHSNPAWAGHGRKRARPDNGDPNDDDDANDDEGAGPSKIPRKASGGKDDTPSFSCPFFKKDSTKYGVCSKYELNRIRDVKQHLTRKHQMPLYCSRCYRIFRDELSRDEHTRNVDCPRSQEGRPEGITESQRKALAKKAPSNQSAKEQWYGIFELLFPQCLRPASPYIDSAFQKSAFVLQSFLLTQGPSIMRSVIQASGALTSPFSQQELDDWTDHVLLQGFQNILARFSTAATVPAAPRLEPTTLASPGADMTSPMNLNYQSPANPAGHAVVNTEEDFVQGGDMFRNSIADSETASSVSGMFSWDTADSEALYNTNAGGAGSNGVPQNGYTVGHFDSNIQFTTQEGLVMQQALNQSMSSMNFENGPARHHSRNNSSRNNFVQQNPNRIANQNERHQLNPNHFGR